MRRQSFTCPLGCLNSTGHVFQTNRESNYRLHLASKTHRSKAKEELMFQDAELVNRNDGGREDHNSNEESLLDTMDNYSTPIVFSDALECEKNTSEVLVVDNTLLQDLLCGDEEYQENCSKEHIQEAEEDDLKLLQLYSLYLNKQIPRNTLTAIINTFSQPLWNTNFPKFSPQKIFKQIPMRLAECGVCFAMNLYFLFSSFFQLLKHFEPTLCLIDGKMVPFFPSYNIIQEFMSSKEHVSNIMTKSKYDGKHFSDCTSGRAFHWNFHDCHE